MDLSRFDELDSFDPVRGSNFVFGRDRIRNKRGRDHETVIYTISRGMSIIKERVVVDFFLVKGTKVDSETAESDDSFCFLPP